MTQWIQMSADTLVSQMPGMVTTDLDGQKVMMNINHGKYFNLDPIGSRIWELIETPRTFKDLVAMLQAEFEVAEGKCQSDVTAFFNKMKELGIITVSM